MVDYNELYETLYIMLSGGEPMHYFDQFDENGLYTNPSEVLPYFLIKWCMDNDKNKVNVINESVDLLSSTKDNVRCDIDATNDYLEFELCINYHLKEIYLDGEYYYKIEER